MSSDVAQRRWSIAAFAASATLAWGILYYAFAVVLTPITEDLGWSTAAVSGAFSTGLFASGAAAPIIGRVVDRSGARGVIAGGTVLGASALLLWSAATSLVTMYLAWLLLGVAMAATLYEPAAATVGRYRPEQRRTALLAISIVTALASTVFSPLTGVLVDLAGWRGGLRVLAAIFVGVGLPVVLAGIPRRALDRNIVAAARPDATVSPLRSSEFRRIAVAFAIGRGLGVGVASHVVAFLITLGYPGFAAAAIAGGIGVAKIAGRVGVTLAQRRVDTVRVTVVVLAVQGTALTLPVLIPGAIGVGSMVVLFGASYGATMILRPELIATRFASQGVGRFNGVAAMLGAFTGATAPLIVGVGVTTGGGYALPWLVLAAAGIAGAALIAPLRPR